MAERDRIAKKRRPYQLRARADAMDRTRARITQAAIELHGSIGPAATTMSSVAERAGVTRATLYRHFPNEEILFRACSAEWRSANPAPDPAGGRRHHRDGPGDVEHRATDQARADVASAVAADDTARRRIDDLGGGAVSGCDWSLRYRIMAA